MKTISVSGDKTLREISEAFNAKFPYLKLKFFAESHEPGEANAVTDELDYDLTVGKAGRVDSPEQMSIDGHLKVSTLEQFFQDHFGISAQVFRRSGGVWLQTTATDEWTLAHQNEEGESDSKGTHSKFSEYKID